MQPYLSIPSKALLTTNQTYGTHDCRSPLQTKFSGNKIQALTQHTNYPIQYSDLRLTPPKKYDDDPQRKFKTREVPTYRKDKVVNEEYHKVLKQYESVEVSLEKRHTSSGKIARVRASSAKAHKMKEKRIQETKKVIVNELPVSVIDNIDKILAKKMKYIKDDILQCFLKD